MTKPELKCFREDCKTYITNITLYNPIKPPTCILECSTCSKKWKGTYENGVTIYNELKQLFDNGIR
jgi:hypothetical protein